MSALDAISRVPAIPSTPAKLLATEFTECGGVMADDASVAVARLGGQARYWGRLGGNNPGTRILNQLTTEGVDVALVRRIQGCVSPSAAILVEAQGERPEGAYNDPETNVDASWLPLERDTECHAVRGDVRWPEGTAAAFDAAARRGILRVFDRDVGPREALIDLVQRATHVIFSEPGLARAAGDVWHGVFTPGLAEGRDVATAGRFTNAAAAIKCARAGRRLGTPRREEVATLMAAGF
jgi:sulfofructose kinase